MFDLEDAMAEVVARSTQPALAAIKLAWWRERLEELDEDSIPDEPRLQACADNLLPRGIAGRDLAQLEEGWAALLAEQLDPSATANHGATLFSLGSRLLGVQFGEALARAGAIYAKVDVARRGVLTEFASAADLSGSRIPMAARPLTALAALALRDLRRGGPPFEPEATPGRALALLRHWLTGIL